MGSKESRHNWVTEQQFFQIFFPFRLLWNIGQCFLCYTISPFVGLSIINISAVALDSNVQVTHVRALVKMEILVQWVWYTAPNHVFLTSFQLTPRLLGHRPHIKTWPHLRTRPFLQIFSPSAYLLMVDDRVSVHAPKQRLGMWCREWEKSRRNPKLGAMHPLYIDPLHPRVCVHTITSLTYTPLILQPLVSLLVSLLQHLPSNASSIIRPVGYF